MTDDKLSQLEVNDVTAAVQQLLQKILTDLKDSTTKQAADEPRLFFPHGIEVISLVVKIGPADVEVTIAGEKGVKSAGLPSIRTASPIDFADDYMEVDWDENKDTIARGDMLQWYNRGTKDRTIVFPAVKCPLNVCRFTVPGNGGSYLTRVLTTVPAGDYPFTRIPATALEDQPKIIIQ